MPADVDAWKAELRRTLGRQLPQRHPDRLTNTEAAQRVGVHPAYFATWLSGSIPSADLVRRYCKAFGRPVREVLEMTGHEADMSEHELLDYVAQHEPEVVARAAAPVIAQAVEEAVSGMEHLFTRLRDLERRTGMPVLSFVELESGFGRGLTIEEAERLVAFTERVIERIRSGVLNGKPETAGK